MASEPAEPTTQQDNAEPMPFDLWWSPSMARFLARHENQDDEHLVWVFHGHHEALRHYLGTGADSNPPLPDDAVRLVLADPEGCGADGCVTFGGCAVCGGEAAFEARRGLIAQAAKVVHSVRYTHDDEPTVVDDAIAGALAEAGLLADDAAGELP